MKIIFNDTHTSNYNWRVPPHQGAGQGGAKGKRWQSHLDCVREARGCGTATWRQPGQFLIFHLLTKIFKNSNAKTPILQVLQWDIQPHGVHVHPSSREAWLHNVNWSNMDNTALPSTIPFHYHWLVENLFIMKDETASALALIVLHQPFNGALFGKEMVEGSGVCRPARTPLHRQHHPRVCAHC